MIMRNMRWMSWLGLVGATVTLATTNAAAVVSSDRAAAIVYYPAIGAGALDRNGSVPGDVVMSQDFYYGAFDTIVQLSNVSAEPVYAHCFYENANGHCTNTGEVCQPMISDSCYESESGFGVCVPGWNEIDFFVRLTPRQPIAWLASEGLTQFPIDGALRMGVDGSSNAGSRIPPVPELPFVGALKCIAVDETGAPIDANVLKGEATFVGQAEGPDLEIAKYNAVGIRAIPQAVNSDRELVLGGPEAEYEGCPSVLILNHFFDGAVSPANVDMGEAEVDTLLVLVPCEQDLLRQICGTTVVQYLVFNEFEQRFSTSRTVNCQQALPLSLIDTTQSDRSIFSAGVAGTTTGQTRMSALEVGLVGVALETHGSSAAAFNVHFQGDRPEADLITLP